MDKNSVKYALEKALSSGEGDLDELIALLERATSDLQAVKQEEEDKKRRKEEAFKAKEAEIKRKQEEEKKKRGNEIAAMANNVLNETVTDEDLALVLTAYFHGRGIKNVTVTPDLIEAAFEPSTIDLSGVEKLVDNWLDDPKNKSMIDNLLKVFREVEYPESKPAPKAKDIPAAYKTEATTAGFYPRPTSKENKKLDSALDDFFKQLGIERSK